MRSKDMKSEVQHCLELAYEMMKCNPNMDAKDMKKYNKLQKNYEKIRETAEKYKLPTIYTILLSNGNGTHSPCFTYSLNGFSERFKGPDRPKLFTESYWNIPMFHQKGGVWYLGPEKSVEQFFKEDFLKKEEMLIKQQSRSAIFKDSSYADIGEEELVDIWGTGGPKFFDRNKFIEGILAKKRKGREDIRDFLRRRLFPVEVFYYYLNCHLYQDYNIITIAKRKEANLDDLIKRIVPKFKEAIENLGIRPIRYNGEYYFWYEDYAMLPSISVYIFDTHDPQDIFFLPLRFFFQCNNSLVWRYFFLEQSGLVRNAKRMADEKEEFPFFKKIYETVCLKQEWAQKGRYDIYTGDGIYCCCFYPIFITGKVETPNKKLIPVFVPVNAIHPPNIIDGINPSFEIKELAEIKKEVLKRNPFPTEYREKILWFIDITQRLFRF